MEDSTSVHMSSQKRYDTVSLEKKNIANKKTILKYYRVTKFQQYFINFLRAFLLISI